LAGRLGPAAGGRFRPVPAPTAVALPDHRLPQPPPAGPGGLRPGGAAAPAVACLEADLPALPAPPLLQGPAPAGAQVADAQLPDQDPAGTLPRRPFRPPRPRPATR